MITLQQMDTIRRVKRFPDSSVGYAAACLVLVEGLRNAEAAKRLGCGTSTVSESVKKYRAADALIRAAYCKP